MDTLKDMLVSSENALMRIEADLASIDVNALGEPDRVKLAEIKARQEAVKEALIDKKIEQLRFVGSLVLLFEENAVHELLWRNPDYELMKFRKTEDAMRPAISLKYQGCPLTVVTFDRDASPSSWHRYKFDFDRGINHAIWWIEGKLRKQNKEIAEMMPPINEHVEKFRALLKQFKQKPVS